jgi:cathepsin L
MKLDRKTWLHSLFVLFATAASFFSLLANPQPPQEPPKSARRLVVKQAQVYVQREQTASPQIKSTLSSLREQIASKKFTFIVGYTKALDEKLETLAGTRVPANLASLARKQNEEATKFLQADQEAKDAFLKVHPGVLPELNYWKLISPCTARAAFDWRKSGKVTGVRDQDGCGSCWAFGALGAYEGSYLIRNSAAIDASEQHVLNCSSSGTCGGGWYAGVFDYLIKTGTATEADDPYTANDKPCKTGVATPYRAVAWAYVKPDASMPSVAELKAALCEHGPLAVAVYVSPLFQAYTGGVFNEQNNSNGINHAVTLIGWDDAKGAWLIKNSWGPYWGETGGYGTERGYIWIAYGSNNIGYGAAWVQAQNRFYILPRRYFELMPEIKPMPGPLRKMPIKKTAPSGN